MSAPIVIKRSCVRQAIETLWQNAEYANRLVQLPYTRKAEDAAVASGDLAYFCSKAIGVRLEKRGLRKYQVHCSTLLPEFMPETTVRALLSQYS